jgi:hypothetical protein
MRGFLTLAAAALLAGPVAAEEIPTHLVAMKKLDFLAGQWAGEATIQRGPGPKETVKQTEDVRFKLGGAVLLVEGTGIGKLPGAADKEGVVFNALATIHYDAAAKQYRMRAIRMEGHAVDPEFALTDGGFTWGFTEPRSKMQVKYTAKVADGTWHEVGAYSRDGKDWTPFFEMTVKRVKE